MRRVALLLTAVAAWQLPLPSLAAETKPAQPQPLDTAEYVPKHDVLGVGRQHGSHSFAHESNNPSAHTHAEHSLGDPAGRHVPAHGLADVPAPGRPTTMLRGDAGTRAKQENREEREEGAKEWFARSGGDMKTLMAFQREFMELLVRSGGVLQAISRRFCRRFCRRFQGDFKAVL